MIFVKTSRPALHGKGKKQFLKPQIKLSFICHIKKSLN